MKRGSALLIVLGMVAFMVISAVAFSAYMRSSRLPSSYLRRTSSSRHLVKAALAEAIDEIDIAIGNDPYPGMGAKGTDYKYPRSDTEYETAVPAHRNYWRSRCYIGTNQLVATTATVSPLCLEALAYLPPALINEVRYFSRHSPAARWHTLGFDAGRYAFAAVDVSDHFDINRVSANVGRNSSDKGRVSLAYLFEKEKHDGWSKDLSPSLWDEFIDKFDDSNRSSDSGGGSAGSAKVPLVSLADFNLAAAKVGGNGLTEFSGIPFYDYIKNGASFVQDAVGTKADLLRSMAFVTDSYLPRTVLTSSTASSSDDSSSSTTYFLSSQSLQPFTFSDLQASGKTLSQVLDYESDGVDLLFENSLCGLSLAALWDYLDEDSVPLSLAIPTTERVPMVVAMDAEIGSCNLKVTGTVTDEGGFTEVQKLDDDHRTVQATTEYTMDGAGFFGGLQNKGVNAVLAYPFRRDEDLNKTFKVGGRVALFFAEDGMTLHTGTSSDILHLGAYNKNQATVQDGVFYLPLDEKDVSFSKVSTSDDALKEVNLEYKDVLAKWLNANPVFVITKQWTQERKVDETTGAETWSPASLDQATDASVVSARCNLPPLSSNGTVDNSYANASRFKNEHAAENDYKKDVKLQMCVWLYVKDENSKYVDLVPACLKDDGDLNGRNSTTGENSEDVMIGGQPYPLLRWGGKTFNTYGPDTFAKSETAEISTYPIMCADPRWNWAPEYWFKMNGSCTKSTWLQNCQVNTGSRDRDIFMATSDICYLQSVYELAFLPRLGDLEQGGAALGLRGYMQAPGNASLSEIAQQFEDTANKDLVWWTYRPFELNGDTVDAFSHVGYTGVGTGFRVNPFSSSEDILMAAFANTPYNWRVAASCLDSNKAIEIDECKVKTFNAKYCFNLMAQDDTAKFEWDDLKNIAKKFRTAVRAQSDGNWRTAFDDLDWAGDRFENGDNWAGGALSGDTADLTDVDKKFLYGYWRDCFAAKQQLFLVFVRAEPAMMGGGSAKSTPPQLGARAVALVWRDPTKTDETNGTDGQPNPHRTRVLFYRQFD